MKKISLVGLDRDCYVETLTNGLEVYMIPLLDKKNYFKEEDKQHFPI